MHSLDLLIRGGRVVDGTGNPWFYGDVAVSDGRISAIAPPGSIPSENAAEVVEAGNHVVSPGFIDIQSHSILPLMIDGRCLSKITQGVTTEIMGESWTPAPVGGRREETLTSLVVSIDVSEWAERVRGWNRFGHWLEAIADSGVSPNVGSFLGGGSLREYVRGMDMGSSSPAELAGMERVVEEAMEDGAFGVSYALIYPPDAFADTDEIVRLCRTVARRGGIYITHLRSEAERLLESLEEAIDIGRRAEVPVEVYHLKASGRDHWHKLPAALEMIENARASGVDVTADMYPYTGSGTGLASILPPWLAAGGRFYENLRDPHLRDRIKQEVLEPNGTWEAMGTTTGPDGVMPVGFERPENRAYVGKRLSETAALRDQHWVDAAIELLVSEQQRIFTIYFSMSEENLRVELQQPWIKISTDAGGVDPTWAKALGPTHPRAYGTYPRVLGRYVREQKLITLEDAVRKMTSSVADRIGLGDRGRLLPGCWADVVIFDPETIVDHAAFDDTHQLSTGVRDVWVNGVPVLRGGRHTGANPGKFVRGPGAA